MLKIGIDMDGVIANWIDSAIKNIKEKFNLELIEEDFTNVRTIELLQSKIPELKDKTKEEIYSIVCPSGFFENLEPYKGAIDSVLELSKNYQIVFVTKPLEYKYSAHEKLIWLKKYFKEIEYDVIFVKDGRAKGLINVHLMIDDDPYVIEHCIESIPLLIEQPYNKVWREKNQIKRKCISLESINDVPGLLFCNGELN